MSEPEESLRLLRSAVEAARQTHQRSKKIPHLETALQEIFNLKKQLEKAVQNVSTHMDNVEQAKSHLDKREPLLSHARYCVESHKRALSISKQRAPENAVHGLLSHADAISVLGKEGEQKNLHAAPNAIEHQKMLQRLAAELLERKRLHKEMDKCRTRKRKLLQKVEDSRRREAKIIAPMDGFLTAAASLESSLPKLRKLDSEVISSPLESELPIPLFVLWRAVAAFFETRQVPASFSIDGVLPDESEESRESTTPFKPHPLGIILKKSQKSNIKIMFKYVPSLKLVSVEVSPKKLSDSLRKLIPGDDGTSFPGPTSQLLLSTLDVDPKSALKDMWPAIPYRWAQWLSGIPPLLDDLRCVVSAETTLRLLFDWLTSAK